MRRGPSDSMTCAHVPAHALVAAAGCDNSKKAQEDIDDSNLNPNMNVNNDSSSNLNQKQTQSQMVHALTLDHDCGTKMGRRWGRRHRAVPITRKNRRRRRGSCGGYANVEAW